MSILKEQAVFGHHNGFCFVFLDMQTQGEMDQLRKLVANAVKI